MSRPWPLLIVTKAGVLHISDAQNAEDDSNYDCRCGRTLSFRGCHHHSSTSSNCYTSEDYPFDEFSTGEYKTARSWFYKGGLKLCPKCGAAADFDAAVDKYREEWKKYEEEKDADTRLRRDIRLKLEKRVGEILMKIAMADVFDSDDCKVDAFDGSLSKGVLKFTIDEFEFEISVTNLGYVVEDKAAAIEEAEESSTECVGG